MSTPTENKQQTQHALRTQAALSELEVADSKFLGFVIQINKNKTKKENDILLKKEQNILTERYPNAAHVPYAWLSSSSKNNEGYNEDSEPSKSVGPYILHELKQYNQENNGIIAIFIVRFFNGTLLGVTCGRLSQCYKHCSKLSLHRYYNPNKPIKIQYADNNTNLYGLASGDTELLLNIMPNDDDEEESNGIFNKIKTELKFDGFKGSYNEILPRLQNLQADIINDNTTSIIPIYRYPGNYNGNEWITYPWSKTSLQIKNIVQTKLDESPSIYNKTTINHCVTNYYRNTQDYIQHHNDKTLDLNSDGVIVSLSLGTTQRTFELRRKVEPCDTYQILLPIGSMLILGPKTNKEFTHSILQHPNVNDDDTKNSNKYERISLTFREVTTYLDESYSGRFYGQGSGFSLNTLNAVRNRHKYENRIISFMSTILSTIITSSFIGHNKKQRVFNSNDTKEIVSFGIGAMSLSAGITYVVRYLRNMMYKYLEERIARNFFTSTSVTGSKY